MSARYYILHEQPKLSFNLLSLGTGIFAVVSPTLIPVALHLAALLLYGPLLFNKRNVLRNSADLWIGLSLVKTLCWAVPAWNAVSNPATSLLTLFFGSAITSFITVGAVLINSALRSRISATGSQLVLFPAIWAAGWYAVSVASPIGRLAMWAPVVDAAGYEWLLPILGPVANDWIAAAWAVVVSETGGYVLMGMEDPEDVPLLQIPTTSKSTSKRTTVLFMSATLVALVIPSFFITNMPLSSASPSTTPLRVGCVLPPRPAHRSLTFDDYLKETAHLWGQTDVLLWPEGAVSFDSEVARDAAFSKVAESLHKYSKALVGVSFIDTESDPADRSGKTLIRRNGIAFISRESEEPGLVYYKRNLVPFTESYSLTHSLPLPEVYTYELLVKKEKRHIPITTSICLDFASPNTFRGLDSKPALILAPASTWDRAVAQTMWQQARQRATELGSTVLWCDGGVSGISGVAGKGMSEATQIGEGSWTRVIGVAFPFDDSRTVYGKAGNALPLAIMAAMFGLGLVGRSLRRIDFKVMNPVALINRWRRVPLEELVRVPTSPTFASVSSSLARSLRGSLRRGSSSSSPYRIQHPSDGDDNDSFFVINQADLTGPAHALDDDSGGSSVLARLKNYSRVSLIRCRTSRKADSNIDSIIDAFPSPPTHIPTPAGPLSSAHSDSSHASSRPSAHPKQRRFSASLKHLAKRAISKKKKRAASLPPLYELSAVIQKPLPSVPPEVNSEPDIPAFIYTFVNPVDLTASPTAFTEDLLAPSSRTSFIPPSPSWLSRNVRINTEPPVQLSSLQIPVAPTQSAPASPLPLPIPPPFPHAESALLSPIDIGERLSRLESYTSSESYSPASSSHSSRRSSSSARTLFDQDETEADLSAITDVPKTLLFKPAGSPAPTFLPIPSIAPRERFIPTKEPLLNINLLPPDLVTSAIESIFAQAGLLISNFNMDAYGKQEGVVDFGGGTDYGNFKFFTDLPSPRHQVPEPEQNTSPYIPNVDVIAQNDTFDFSLRAAPNVLYARYKQYGQLGVLAWCSEFGELIDALKTLGFQGNMFVSTRAAALQTCEEILRIRLPDVQMQIIIMYLSSQVARLRRFLDGDRVWDDYPELTFPLEPTATKPPSMT